MWYHYANNYSPETHFWNLKITPNWNPTKNTNTRNPEEKKHFVGSSRSFFLGSGFFVRSRSPIGFSAIENPEAIIDGSRTPLETGQSNDLY